MSPLKQVRMEGSDSCTQTGTCCCIFMKWRALCVTLTNALVKSNSIKSLPRTLTPFNSPSENKNKMEEVQQKENSN